MSAADEEEEFARFLEETKDLGEGNDVEPAVDPVSAKREASPAPPDSEPPAKKTKFVTVGVVATSQPVRKMELPVASVDRKSVPAASNRSDTSRDRSDAHPFSQNQQQPRGQGQGQEQIQQQEPLQVNHQAFAMPNLNPMLSYTLEPNQGQGYAPQQQQQQQQQQTSADLGAGDSEVQLGVTMVSGGIGPVFDPQLAAQQQHQLERQKALDAAAAVSSSEGGTGSGGASESTLPVMSAGGDVWVDPTLVEWDPKDHRVFIGNLGPDVTDDVLRGAFSRFASLKKVKVVRDSRTGKSKGYGFASFGDPRDYINAIDGMNGKYVGNRTIKVTKSKWKDRVAAPGSEKPNYDPNAVRPPRRNGDGRGGGGRGGGFRGGGGRGGGFRGGGGRGGGGRGRGGRGGGRGGGW